MSDTIAPVIAADFGRQTDVKGGRSYCAHRQYVVDGGKRTVVCGSCGVTLDALEVLLDYAHRERSFRDLAQEVRQAEERLQDLRTEERKVKARTKAASKKDADAAVAAERARSEQERFQIIQAARDIAASCRRIERLTTRRRKIT